MPHDAAPGLAERPPAARAAPRRGLMVAGIAGVVGALAVVLVGVVGRAHEARSTQAWTDAQATPTVKVVQPTTQGAAAPLTLPGKLQAWYNAPIYSRVSGYVRAWYKDIGAPVRRGELLAVIDTPETDQQIIQARADLATAQANMKLARTTAERWSRLLKEDAVSAQESDEKAGDYAARTAMAKAAQANLDRLLALKAFSRITAPFDGVVTARRTDIGALVNAGAGAAANTELFDVAEVDRLRLYVQTPQSSSAEMRPGVAASFTVPEHPGETFHAAFAATANAISDRSGTLQTELHVDNAAGLLQPGDYAEVRFAPAAGQGGAAGLLLPSSSLLFRDKGAQVATVDADGRVRILPIVVGRNYGGSMQVLSGVPAGARVIDDPPDSIAEGERVRLAASPAGG